MSSENPAPVAPASPAASHQEAGLLGKLGWALYQFAGSPYFVIINIFVFTAYFQRDVVGDPVQGQVVWGYTQAAAGFIIAIFSPILGALADVYGRRKGGLILFSALAVIPMVALWWVTPGMIWLGVVSIIAAAVLMEFAAVYHNSLLTVVASDRNVGLMSGVAYAVDYLGSVTMFIFWLAMPALGLVALLEGEYAHERSVGILSALWLTVFSIPFVLWTPDRRHSGLSIFASIGRGLRQLGRTIVKVRHYDNIAKFLVVRAIYADGMTAVFTFLTAYLVGVFGWETEKVGIYALIVLTVPIFTSALGGYIDDAIGSRRTIRIGLFMFTAAVASSFGTTPNEYLFLFPIDDALRAHQLPVVGSLMAGFGFTTFPEQVSLSFSVIGGIFVGPVLAASRTMVARISPTEMVSEVFGLYTLTGKATAFVAPATVAFVTDVTNNQRIGVSVILLFLIAGVIGLRLVREERAVVAKA